MVTSILFIFKINDQVNIDSVKKYDMRIESKFYKLKLLEKLIIQHAIRTQLNERLWV